VQGNAKVSPLRCAFLLRLTVLLVAALIWPTPARAAVTGDWGGYQAVASRLHVPLPDAYIHRGECPVVAGAACAYQNTGDIWLPADSDRFTLAHELGHMFDAQFLDDRERKWLRRLMHAPGGDWGREWGAAEWFADYYATCAIRPRPHEFTTGYISFPIPNLQRVCNAIWVLWLVRERPDPEPPLFDGHTSG
jgi:hypothetical protein